jgi:glycosyltransferase involved in cell wall biosynthesis
LSAKAQIRVALELTGLELDAAGSARAIRALQAELQRDPEIELLPLAQPRAGRQGGAARVWRGLRRELLYMPFQLPTRAAREGADLLHCPVGVAPVRRALPLVVTVNDVMAIEHPDWFTRANALQQRFVLPRALRVADRVLCPSRYTHTRLIELLRLDPARVDVTPYGVGPPFGPGEPSTAALGRMQVTQPYVLAVGTLQPRKNLEAALQTFGRVASAGAPHSLVVVGAPGWHDESIRKALARSAADERVRFLGRVTDPDLVELYRGADCLFFPSLYEGFGFPVLEAMACGTPVLCANSTSLPEVAAGAAVLEDPRDPEALESALAALLSSADRRGELAAAGLARAGELSWSRFADLTVAAYRRTLER